MGSVGAFLATWGTLGFAATAPASIALSQCCAGVTALGLVLAFAARRLRYRPTGLELPLALFILAEALSIAFAADRRWSLRAFQDDWPVVFFLVFAQALRHSRDVRRAFIVLLTSSSIVALLAVWQVLSGTDPVYHRTLDPIGNYYIGTGLFGHHLTYGGTVLITGMLALTLLSARPTLRLGASTVLLLCGIVASFARTVWLGLAVGIVGLAVAARGRVRRVSIALLLLGAVAAIAIPPIRLRLAAFLAFHDDPRMRLWETALRIWREHPIFGAGVGSFRLLFERYKVPGFYMSTGHPHNDLLKILVNSGIIGLAAFTFIWVRYFRHILRLRRRLEATDPRRALLLAGILVVVAFLAGAMGQCFLSDETVADLFWFLVAASLVTAREVQEEVA